MEDVSISSLERRPCYCFFENEPGCFVAIRQRVSDAASYIFSLLSSLFQWTGSASDDERGVSVRRADSSLHPQKQDRRSKRSTQETPLLSSFEQNQLYDIMVGSASGSERDGRASSSGRRDRTAKKTPEEEDLPIDFYVEKVSINSSQPASPIPDPSKREEQLRNFIQEEASKNLDDEMPRLIEEWIKNPIFNNFKRNPKSFLECQRPRNLSKERCKVIEFLCPLFGVSFDKLVNRDAAEKKLEEAELFFQDQPLKDQMIDAAQNEIEQAYDIRLNRKANGKKIDDYEKGTVECALHAFFGMQSDRQGQETAPDAEKRKWIIDRAREENEKDNGFEFDKACYRTRTLNWIAIWAYSEEFDMFCASPESYGARTFSSSGKSIPAQGRQFIASSIEDFKKEFSPKSNLPQ